MLVLSRHVGETVQIGENVIVTVLRIRGTEVGLGFVGPPEIAFLRGELVGPIHRDGRKHTLAQAARLAARTETE